MKGNGWVGHFPNGTSTGMVAQLVNKEADLSIAQASMIMMINDLSAITFLHATSAGQFAAIFRQPGSQANLTISAFSKHSWTFYFVTWIIIVVSVYVIQFMRVWVHDGHVSGRDVAFTKNVIFWALTTMCVKGDVKIFAKRRDQTGN